MLHKKVQGHYPLGCKEVDSEGVLPYMGHGNKETKSATLNIFRKFLFSF